MFHYNPDNKIIQALSSYFDLAVLAALWAVTSAPVVTAGVSTTALYRVLFRMQDEDGVTHVVRSFFACWRSEWKKSTAVWLLLLAGMALAGCDLFICAAYRPEGPFGALLWAGALLALLLCLCLAVWVFPINARFDCTVRQVFSNAIRFTAGNLLRTLALMALLALRGISVFLLLALSVFVLGPLLHVSAKQLSAAFTPVIRRYEAAAPPEEAF